MFFCFAHFFKVVGINNVILPKMEGTCFNCFETRSSDVKEDKKTNFFCTHHTRPVGKKLDSLSTLINTAPFGTLITPGVVPIMMHTLLCLLVAHPYDARVISKPFVCFPANFLVTSAKYSTLYVIYTHL